MTLEEGIKHCEEVAKEKRIEANYRIPPKADCLKCAEEHDQLAEWLKELKAYKEAEAEKEAREEARREAMKLDEADGTLKWRGHA